MNLLISRSNKVHFLDKHDKETTILIPKPRFEDQDIVLDSPPLEFPGKFPYDIARIYLEYLFSFYLTNQEYERACALISIDPDFVDYLYYKYFSRNIKLLRRHKIRNSAAAIKLIAHLYERYIAAPSPGTDNPFAVRMKFKGSLKVAYSPVCNLTPWGLAWANIDPDNPEDIEFDIDDVLWPVFTDQSIFVAPPHTFTAGEKIGDLIWCEGAYYPKHPDIFRAINFFQPVIVLMLERRYRMDVVTTVAQLESSEPMKKFVALLKHTFGATTGVFFVVGFLVDEANELTNRFVLHQM